MCLTWTECSLPIEWLVCVHVFSHFDVTNIYCMYCRNHCGMLLLAAVTKHIYCCQILQILKSG